VKPAVANDGWIDEAFTTWYTSSPPRARQWAQPFDRSEPPVVLRPADPLSRYTPREAYAQGARFFAGVAHVLGGPDALVAVMADVFRSRSGGFLSTDDLEGALSKAAGKDLRWAFERWVHGKEPGVVGS
jgi:aminopeptidase N